MLSVTRAIRWLRELTSLQRGRSSRLIWLWTWLEAGHGKMQNSRISILMLKVRSLKVVTCTLYSRYALISAKFSSKWASVRCQLASSLRALSGTLTPSSSLRVTPLVTCTIHSFWRSPLNAKVSLQIIAKVSKIFTRKAVSAHLVTNTNGISMRQKRIFCVLTLPQSVHRCCMLSLSRARLQKDSSQWNTSQSIESSVTRLSMLLILQNSIRLKVSLPIEILVWATFLA